MKTKKIIAGVIFVTIICLTYILGYKVGHYDALNMFVKIPIVNKVYLPDEQIEYENGSPIYEYVEMPCRLKGNTLDTAGVPSCSEHVLQGYQFIENEVIKKIWERAATAN